MPDFLVIEGLAAGYGKAVAVRGIEFSLAEGGALARLGATVSPRPH